MATETTTPAPVTPLMEGAVIGKWTARGLTAAFLILIVVPSIHQLIYSKGTEAKKFARLFRHAPKAVDLHKFEEQLARDSNLSGQARPFRGKGYSSGGGPDSPFAHDLPGKSLVELSSARWAGVEPAVSRLGARLPQQRSRRCGFGRFPLGGQRTDADSVVH